MESLDDRDFRSWLDMGSFWLYPDEQCKSGWFRARAKRLTSSRIAEALGVVKYNPDDCPEKTARQLAGLEKKEFTIEAKARMQFGIDHEDDARKWYIEATGHKVVETGHAVPKWNTFLGGSPDGVVGTKGLLEIKCPQKMYLSILRYQTDCEMGHESGNYDHIPISHYLQMQTCLAIMDREWYDYVVYCIPESKVFKQRIPFDKETWDNKWYPMICNFIDNQLKPLL